MDTLEVDRLHRFYRLVRELIDLRVSVGYDLNMVTPDGCYRVQITKVNEHGQPQ